MRRMYNLLVVMLIVMAGTLNAQPVEVTNGGFELGIVDGWGKDINDGAVGSYEEETEDVQEGAIALRATVDNLGTNPWSMQIHNDTWVAESDKTYMLSIWAKDISEDDANVLVNFTVGLTNNTDTWKEATRLQDSTLAKDWKEYRIYFAPATADLESGLFAYMSLHLVGLGVALFDNFTVTETQTIGVTAAGNQATIEFIPSLADPAGNEANISVTVGGVANPVTAIALFPTSKKKLVLTLANAIAEGQEVVVNYTPGSLITTTGITISAFSLTTIGGPVSVFSKNAKTRVTVYPNPANDVVYFDVDNVRSVDIYNVAGKLIKSVETEENSMSVKELNSGIYFFEIKNSQGTIFNNKIVVE